MSDTMYGTKPAPVLATAEVFEAVLDPAAPAAIEGSAESPVTGDVSATADPENAHSPMSPDGHVSNEHTGLHTEEHSTHGTTPAS